MLLLNMTTQQKLRKEGPFNTLKKLTKNVLCHITLFFFFIHKLMSQQLKGTEILCFY